MSFPSWAWAVLAGAASVGVVAACVGDDPAPTNATVQPDPNAKPGEFRGRCDNGRCLTGLRCDTSLDICVPDDAGVSDDGGASSSGGSSGGSSSGGSSGNVDAGPCAYNPGATPQHRCLVDGGECTNPYLVCCLSQDVSDCRTTPTGCTSTNGSRPIACIGDDTCSGEDICCITANTAITAQCNVVPVGSFIQTTCAPSVDGGCSSGTRVCRQDSECPSPQKCWKMSIEGNPNGTLVLGVCS